MADGLKTILVKSTLRWCKKSFDSFHDDRKNTVIDITSPSKDTLSLFIDKYVAMVFPIAIVSGLQDFLVFICYLCPLMTLFGGNCIFYQFPPEIIGTK